MIQKIEAAVTKPTWVVATLLLVAWTSAIPQDVPPNVSAFTSQDSTDYGSLFIVGEGVTAPQLLPKNLTLAQSDECKHQLSGDTTLSFLVTVDGVPRNIAFEHGSGRGLDELAFKIVSLDRFEPAMHEGKAVTVPMKVEVELGACTVDMQTPHGKKQTGVKPRLEPRQEFRAMSSSEAELEFSPTEKLQRVGQAGLDHTRSSVSAPAPLNNVNATLSDEALKNKVNGVCLVTMIVDKDGAARDVRVIRALGYGLDERAVEAVRKYRFKPAMSEGKAVPVRVVVEINFRSY